MAAPTEDIQPMPCSKGRSETTATSNPISSLLKRVMNSRTTPYTLTGKQSTNTKKVDPIALCVRRKRTISFEFLDRFRPIRHNTTHLHINGKDGGTFPATRVPATTVPIPIATDTAFPSSSSRPLPRSVIVPGAYAVKHGDESKDDLNRRRAF